MSTSSELEAAAIDLRQRGQFDDAQQLFAEAAALSDDPARRLNLQVRQACCLLSVDRSAEAADLALLIAERARVEGCDVELTEALGLIVDHYARVGRIAEGANLLSEALDRLDRLPRDSSSYQVVHNMAATLERAGFFLPAIELFRQALDLASNDEERAFTRSSMASPHHYAAASASDPEEQHRILVEGLEFTEDDDTRACEELLTASSGTANRAMLLAHIGRYHEALAVAATAKELATSHGLVEDRLFAVAAAAISNWRLHRDAEVLASVTNALALAERLQRIDELAILQDVEVEILWSLGRFDEARHRLEARLAGARRRVAEERNVRWQHVRLGVEHRRVELLSTSDPLTGLANRRHLERALPEVLATDEHVVVAVVDLDGFKQVNDRAGYTVGDSVIQEVASLLESACRRSDSVVRLGGDEFVLILRHTTLEQAMPVVERFRRQIAEHAFGQLPADIRLSASIGVLPLEAGDRADLTAVLAAASEAVRESKQAGKDRVTVRRLAS